MVFLDHAKHTSTLANCLFSSLCLECSPSNTYVLTPSLHSDLRLNDIPSDRSLLKYRVSITLCPSPWLHFFIPWIPPDITCLFNYISTTRIYASWGQGLHMFRSHLDSQSPGQCLTHNGCSINIYWLMIEWTELPCEFWVGRKQDVRRHWPLLTTFTIYWEF